MGHEQGFSVIDHKMLHCPRKPEHTVDAWLADNRLVLLSVDSAADPTVAAIIGSATISIPLYNFNKPFGCPGCAGSGCTVVTDGATGAREIPKAFQSIRIVSVPV